jgi:hypothetical protein
MGLPTIVTAETNVADLVEDEGAGWRAESSARGLCQAIVRAATATDMPARAAAASRLAHTAFDIDCIAHGLARDLERTLS